MKSDNDKNDKTLKRFQGSSFEVSGASVWKIFYSGKMLGPYNCLKIRDLLEKGEVSIFDWVCKIEKEKWSRAKDIIDFNGQINIVDEEVDGKKIQRIFVKRSPRAIYYAPAKIETNEKLLFTGTCSSLSTTGIFLEMVVSKIEKLKLGERIKLTIMADQIPKMESIAEIVQINMKTPKGIALKFIGLNPEYEKKIEAFVKNVT